LKAREWPRPARSRGSRCREAANIDSEIEIGGRNRGNNRNNIEYRGP